ncbi:GNAT family N-acetyltransferase [Virgibacillus xinjiangensis]|uniref:GNAT family N-acetyltransferase n=1 Tax=Virgibacillus xinjiangensis TaxID=393090 RepID=A0ABV7CXP6_9BACI
MFLLEVDEQITLKILHLSDAEELFLLTDRSREYLREWLPWVDATKTVDDSRGFIQHARKQYAERKGLACGIFYQGCLAGTVAFNSFDWLNRIGYIGYWLAPYHQGKGIMTRACQSLIHHAFYILELNKIDIRAAYENKKSRAIPERLGFMKEGQIRQAEWLYDHYVDHVVYGLLAREWKEKHSL